MVMMTYMERHLFETFNNVSIFNDRPGTSCNKKIATAFLLQIVENCIQQEHNNNLAQSKKRPYSNASIEMGRSETWFESLNKRAIQNWNLLQEISQTVLQIFSPHICFTIHLCSRKNTSHRLDWHTDLVLIKP